MSDIKTEEIVNEGLKRQFRITVPAERVQARVDHLIREKGKTYAEPGFRPGKVPFERLKMVFEGSATEKAVPEILQETASTFLKEQAVTPAFKPEYTLENYEPAKELIYTLSFEIMPEVPEISDDGLKLRRAALKISDTDIDIYVKEWAASYKDSQPLSKKRPAQKGDLLRVMMTITPKGAKESEKSEMDFVLTEEELRPEILQVLLGTQPGDTVSQDIFFPKNAPDRKLAGKMVHATFEVQDIREQIPFEPTLAFAQFLKLKDLEEVQSRAKQALEKQGEHMAFLWVKRQILDFFAKKYTFEVPARMVDLEYQSIWDQTYKEIGVPAKAPENDPAAQSSRAELFQSHVGKSEKELEDFYRKAATRRVRLGFVLTQYGKTLDVQVTDKEMQAAFLEELKKYPGEEKKVMEFYRNNPQAFSRLQAPVFEDKLLRHLADRHLSEPEEMMMDTLLKLIENEEGF